MRASPFDASQYPIELSVRTLQIIRLSNRSIILAVQSLVMHIQVFLISTIPIWLIPKCFFLRTKTQISNHVQFTLNSVKFSMSEWSESLLQRKANHLCMLHDLSWIYILFGWKLDFHGTRHTQLGALRKEWMYSVHGRRNGKTRYIHKLRDSGRERESDDEQGIKLNRYMLFVGARGNVAYCRMSTSTQTQQQLKSLSKLMLNDII